MLVLAKRKSEKSSVISLVVIFFIKGLIKQELLCERIVILNNQLPLNPHEVFKHIDMSINGILNNI